SPSVLRPNSFTVSPSRVAVVQVLFVPAPFAHSASFARPHFAAGEVQPSQLSFQPRYTLQRDRTYPTAASAIGAHHHPSLRRPAIAQPGAHGAGASGRGAVMQWRPTRNLSSSLTLPSRSSVASSTGVLGSSS